MPAAKLATCVLVPLALETSGTTGEAGSNLQLDRQAPIMEQRPVWADKIEESAALSLEQIADQLRGRLSLGPAIGPAQID